VQGRRSDQLSELSGQEACIVEQGKHPQKIVIVGGGITGLAAAHALAQANARYGWGIETTLIEATARFGGKVQTEHADGFLVEQGPDSMLARKIEAQQLCVELGLADDLVGSSRQHSGTFVVHRGRLEPLPESMVLVAPTHLRPWLKTRLLSPAGKLRAALDLILPARTGEADESLAAFVSRRFGHEVAERLAIPLLASVYGGGRGDLSVQATFPELHALERAHRSLLLGLRATATRQNRVTRPAGGASSSVFVSLRRGMHSMVARAVERLEGARLLCGAPVVGLTLSRQPHEGWRYGLHLAGGGVVEADGVILATPAFVTQRLVERLAPPAAEALVGIEYQNTIVVVVAYPRERIAHPLNGTGFLVPAAEQRRIIACTWLSQKWPHTSPTDRALLRCYVGGREAPALMALPDDALVGLVHDELRDLLGAEGAPVFSRVYRWGKAIPRYAVGHLERVRRAEAALRALPSIAIAGAGYRGIGVPDCIRQGRAAAAALLGMPVGREAVSEDILTEPRGRPPDTAEASSRDSGARAAALPQAWPQATVATE